MSIRNSMCRSLKIKQKMIKLCLIIVIINFVGVVNVLVHDVPIWLGCIHITIALTYFIFMVQQWNEKEAVKAVIADIDHLKLR